MDRYTRRISDGNIWPVHGVQNAFRRLADYEDTGLTPEEVRDLKDAWNMYGGKYGIREAMQDLIAYRTVESKITEALDELELEVYRRVKAQHGT